MTHEPRHTKTPVSADREPPRERDDDARERLREREWRIGAAQVAAPTSRTWRRAGRYSSPS
jgi:hypothetical protein